MGVRREAVMENVCATTAELGVRDLVADMKEWGTRLGENSMHV
jgi:hypothetical protein